MTNWLSRLFGYSCCGPWSPWSKQSGQWSITHQVLAGVRISLSEPVRYTKHWQERSCMKCGKIQQEALEY